MTLWKRLDQMMHRAPLGSDDYTTLHDAGAYLFATEELIHAARLACKSPDSMSMEALRRVVADVDRIISRAKVV